MAALQTLAHVGLARIRVLAGHGDDRCVEYDARVAIFSRNPNLLGGGLGASFSAWAGVAWVVLEVAPSMPRGKVVAAPAVIARPIGVLALWQWAVVERTPSCWRPRAPCGCCRAWAARSWAWRELRHVRVRWPARARWCGDTLPGRAARVIVTDDGEPLRGAAPGLGAARTDRGRGRRPRVLGRHPRLGCRPRAGGTAHGDGVGRQALATCPPRPPPGGGASPGGRPRRGARLAAVGIWSLGGPGASDRPLDSGPRALARRPG